MGARGDTEPGAFERRFVDALARLPVATPVRRWLIAFSGGVDSTLLLHLLRQTQPATPIVAIHVDHGWHPDSSDWSAHCARVARELGVDYVGHAVRVAPDSAFGAEAAAREARYSVLAGMLEAGDTLLTAHHADDQLETVLLRLLRGTGVRGLTAIRRAMPCGPGWLARPLLDFTRAEIRDEALRRGLSWLEDPSNRDLRFDRNYLRGECLPPLLARWPHAGLLAGRLARQMAEAEAVLEDMAEKDLEAAPEPDRIPVASLTSLSRPRLDNALRHAVRRLGLPVPSAAQLAELRRGLAARADAETLVCWPGAEARCYRGHLYLLAAGAAAASGSGRVRVDQALHLSHGELSLVGTTGYGIPDRWARDGLEVSFRVGGERFRPYRSPQRKSLKHWFQEAGIVPWMRSAVPLLYRGEQLVAVGDLCLAADLPQAPDDAPFWRPSWSGHARLR